MNWCQCVIWHLLHCTLHVTIGRSCRSKDQSSLLYQETWKCCTKLWLGLHHLSTQPAIKQTNKQIWSCSDDILHTPSFIQFRPAPPSWLTLKTNAAEAQRVTSRQQEPGAELSWRQCTWLLSQSCVWKEAAGPLKAKMVSCKLHLLPSVSFLPFRDHRAFKIEPELTWRTEGKPDTQDTHKHTHKEDFVFLFLH